MLGGYYNRLHTNRAVSVILYGDLGLSIRAQIGQCAILSDLGQTFGQAMG